MGEDGKVDPDGRRILSCASVASDDKFDGNHVVFSYTGPNILELSELDDKYCEPEVPECRCNELLDKLLQLEKNVIQIDTMMNVQSFSKGCLCYLGASARAGFKFVQMTQYVNPKPECIDKKPIRKGNPFQPLYISVCDAYETNKCGNGPIKITKT